MDNKMGFRCFDKTKGKKYACFTVYPFDHRLERMRWAAAVEINLAEAESLLFLSGQTGRDPESDRQPQNWEDERKGAGRLVGGIKEQTEACWMRIKEILEGLGAKMEDIVHIRKYLVRRDDKWDHFEAQHNFFSKYCPDLIENRRATTLIEGVTLDLPDMLIEIEVVAVKPKKR